MKKVFSLFFELNLYVTLNNIIRFFCLFVLNLDKTKSKLTEFTFFEAFLNVMIFNHLLLKQFFNGNSLDAFEKLN